MGQHAGRRLSASKLAPGERVVLPLHTHAKALVRPAILLILLGGMLGAGTALVPSTYRPGGQYVVSAVVLALTWWWSVVPFLRWRSRTYTITNHRLVTRSGLLHRSGHTVALARVQDLSYERGLADRLLGCGTLVVQTAAEGALVLEDVPDVRHVHQVLTDLTRTGQQDAPTDQTAGVPWTDGPTALTASPGSRWSGPPAASWPVR